MLSQDKKPLALLFFLVLLFGTWLIWLPTLNGKDATTLTVTFLDVGQGDAIFIETPSGRQILIDGGRDNSVLRELGKVMSFLDRSIDIVVATHPDADHITGLIEVFKRYEISTFLRPGVKHDTPATQSLFSTLGSGNTEEILARRGQVFDFGDGVYIRVLFPDRDVSDLESNAASIILKVTFGEHSFLLTGDSPKHIENYVASLDTQLLASTVLKAGHHGSKTSSSETFIGFVNPEYVVLSRGCENSYGHPHQEVLDVLNNFNIEILDTCEEGTVTFSTDGTILQIKK